MSESKEQQRIRLIIKHTYQPPIDTPASITWSTVDVDNAALLAALLQGNDYTWSAVVGAEILAEKES